jgi:hypothetical protein
MPGRTVIYVVGFTQQHYRVLELLSVMNLPGMSGIDCRHWMPRDPNADRSLNVVDSVACQDGFTHCVTLIYKQAKLYGRSLVGCKAGKHRSIVAAATASQICIQSGMPTVVVELNMIQLEHIEMFVNLAEDWKAGLRATVNLPCHWSNGNILDFATIPTAIANLEYVLAVGCDVTPEEEGRTAKQRRMMQEYRVAIEHIEQHDGGRGASRSAGRDGGRGVSSSSSRTLPPPTLPPPPPPPPAPKAEKRPFDVVGGGETLSTEELDFINELGLDSDAIDMLDATKVNEARKILNKFKNKPDINNASAFVRTACRNAQNKTGNW